ncbi:MAG: cystathionine beta-synthase, partial [Pseudomonadota bacterium]
MRAIIQRWLVVLILGFGVISSVNSEDVTEPEAEPEAATLSREEIQTILDTKFSEGKYSRRGPDGCLRCHDDTSDKPATGIFDNV